MLRRKLLKTQDDPYKQVDIIVNLDPGKCSSQDVKTLLLIRKGRPSDRLAHLGMEADWWLKNHFEVLRRRFLEEQNK